LYAYRCPDKCQDDERAEVGVETQLNKGKSAFKRSAPTAATAHPSDTGNERKKKSCCVTVAQGMETMLSSLDNALSTLTDMVISTTQVTQQKTPCSEALELQTWAMEAIERDEDFMKEEVLDASQVIITDTSLANMYLTFKDKALHTSFLHRHMKAIKKHD
jgi:hypothetical protein